MTSTIRITLIQGQRAMNARLARAGYTPEQLRALTAAPLWRMLCATLDRLALAGDLAGVQATYRVAWQVAEGPAVLPRQGHPSPESEAPHAAL